MHTDPAAIEAIALLDEPARRALYEWVAAQPDAVGRDAAAEGVGVSRALAAFHLDRLTEGGLLEVEFRRLSGRTGPGAGRPAKLYRRSRRDVSISLPDRRYEAAARILAEAAARDADAPSPAIRDAAREAGLPVGIEARNVAGPRPSRARRRSALVDVLRDRGYEPVASAKGPITMRNCPFDALVDDHRDVICAMNTAWAGGVLEGLGDDPAAARLDPAEGRCCVVIDA